jgi:hypothetical protein
MMNRCNYFRGDIEKSLIRECGASDFSLIMMLILGAVAFSAVTSFNSCVLDYNRKHKQHWVEVPGDYEGDVYSEKPARPSLEDFE